MAALLRTNRNFRLVLSASAISNLGDGVSLVALPWLATLLTRDPLPISLVAMAGRLPWFLFAIPAGVVTDRMDRRQLMVRADVARLGLTLVIVGMILTLPPLPLAASAGTGPVLVLSGLSFMLGTAEVLRDNAAQTVLPAIVAHDDLERANGQIWSAEQLMGQFAGPPLAGVLIGAGIVLPFGLDAATFAVAAGLVWLVALPPRTAAPTQPFWPALREGVAWMAANRLMLRLALMLGAVNASYTAILTLLALYAQEVLGLSALGYGLLLTAGAAGAVIGGLCGPVIARRLGMRASLVTALVALAVAFLVLGGTRSPILAGATLFVEGLAGMLWNIVTVSYRQRTIPDALLGRVNAIYRFFGWGSMPVGAIVAGTMASMAESVLGRDLALRGPILLAGVVVALLAAHAVWRFPRNL